jgi:arabinofuranan 3-O-arabinosyltransferase
VTASPPGWCWARVRAGVDLGSSTLIDGYANGWYLPSSLTRGTATFTLTWTPQRVVNAALVVSGVTLVVSVVLIALPPGLVRSGRRRRRRRSVGPRGTTGATTEVANGVAASASDVGAGAGATGRSMEPEEDPVRPVLTSVVRSGGSTPGWILSLGLALVGGVAAGLIVAPAAGVVVAAVALLELRVDRSRMVVVAATVGLLVATCGYVALHQHRNGFLSDINWPSHMGWANSLVWVAVCLLGADGLVQWVRHRHRHRHRGRPGDAAGYE